MRARKPKRKARPRVVPPFMQIAPVVYDGAEGPVILYGLDRDGAVWQKIGDEQWDTVDPRVSRFSGWETMP